MKKYTINNEDATMPLSKENTKFSLYKCTWASYNGYETPYFVRHICCKLFTISFSNQGAYFNHG